MDCLFIDLSDKRLLGAACANCCGQSTLALTLSQLTQPGSFTLYVVVESENHIELVKHALTQQNDRSQCVEVVTHLDLLERAREFEDKQGILLCSMLPNLERKEIDKWLSSHFCHSNSDSKLSSVSIVQLIGKKNSHTDTDHSNSEQNIAAIGNSATLLSLIKNSYKVSTNNDDISRKCPIDIAIDDEKVTIRFLQSSASLTQVRNFRQQRQLDLDRRMSVAEKLSQQGVVLMDWYSLEVQGTVTASPGVRIDSNVSLRGKVQLARGVQIGSHCDLNNVVIGENTKVLPFSMLEDCEIGTSCRIGPFARVRSQTKIGSQSSIGNFVEIKASEISDRGLINHLAFVGDTQMGKHVIIGAGVITCNYDGEKTTHTQIEDGALIGSGSQLVAPVTIGKNSTIGAGSTITSGVTPNSLALGRARQVEIQSWTPSYAKKRNDSQGEAE